MFNQVGLSISSTGGGSAAPSAFTKISSQTMASPTASVTFSSIPQTYTHLMILFNAGCSTTLQNLQMIFNGDSGADYSYIFFYNAGGTLSSSGAAGSSTAIGLIATLAPLGNAGQIFIPLYANSVFQKSAASTGTSTSGATTPSPFLGSLVWSASTAINSITLQPTSAANFTTGSVFTLYGIS